MKLQKLGSVLPVAIGLRVKTGRAIAVVLGNSASSPEFVGRHELLLYDKAVPGSGQPYHAALDLEQPEATATTRRLSEIVRKTTNASMGSLIGELRRQGRKVRGAGLVVSSLTDPSTIHNPHMHAHAAEGQLYRQAVEDALERCDLAHHTFMERDVHAKAVKALGLTSDAIAQAVLDMRNQAGAPWRAEEKSATVAAWIALRQ